jgi:hypothetical protein
MRGLLMAFMAFSHSARFAEGASSRARFIPAGTLSKTTTTKTV